VNLQNRGTLNLDDEVATAAQAIGLGGQESGYAWATAQGMVPRPARPGSISAVQMWLTTLIAKNVGRTLCPVNG
jgi:C4-dicarboxylate transporter